jgi:hypothetical protein
MKEQIPGVLVTQEQANAKISSTEQGQNQIQ